GWNCTRALLTFDATPQVVLHGFLFYSDSTVEEVRIPLDPSNPVNNLKPRNFMRTQITLGGAGSVKLSEPWDKAIKQAFEAYIGAASTQTATSEDETP